MHEILSTGYKLCHSACHIVHIHNSARSSIIRPFIHQSDLPAPPPPYCHGLHTPRECHKLSPHSDDKNMSPDSSSRTLSPLQPFHISVLLNPYLINGTGNWHKLSQFFLKPFSKLVILDYDKKTHLRVEMVFCLSNILSFS